MLILSISLNPRTNLILRRYILDLHKANEIVRRAKFTYLGAYHMGNLHIDDSSGLNKYYSCDLQVSN